MAGLSLSVEKSGKVSVVNCEGIVDSETSGEIEKAVTSLILAKQYRIVIDLEKVEYVSSAGWGIFVGYVRDLRKNGGDIRFSNMRQEVREVFELLDFTNILQCYGTREEAVKAFK
mgnify:CR=1 FL=1